MKLFRYMVVILAISIGLFACQKNPPAKKEAPEPPAPSSIESVSPVVEPEVLATSEPESDPIVVSSITGTAEFQHAASGAKQPLTVGQTLVESDIITTGDDAVIVITLEEGKEIHLGGNTVFALSAIRRDSNGNVNILALKQGSIVNVVDTKLADDDVYEVHTPRLVMSVRGTSNYMATGADGDTVIGITGETHVFSDGTSFNVPQGSAVSQPEGAPPVIAPSDSESLPPLAADFASNRHITYPAMSEGDLARSQQNADSFKPSQDFAASLSFANTLFDNSEITAPNAAPALMSIAEEPQPEVLPPPPAVTAPAPVTTPAPEITPTPVSAPAPAPAEPAQSSSSVENPPSLSRSFYSSGESSSSTSTPEPKPKPKPTPPPTDNNGNDDDDDDGNTYNHFHIKYTNFATGNAVNNGGLGNKNNDGYYRVSGIDIDDISELTEDLLPVLPTDYYMVSFVVSERVPDGHILVNAKVLLKTESIMIRLYEGTIYNNASGNVPTTAEVLFEGDIATAVDNAIAQYSTKRIVPDTVIDSSMLFASGVYPAGVSGGSPTGLSLWIPIESIPVASPASLSVLLLPDFTEPPLEDESDPPSENSAEPTSEDSTEPTSEDSTEPPSEDSAEPESEDSTEPPSEDSTELPSEDSAEPESEDSAVPTSEDSTEV